MRLLIIILLILVAPAAFADSNSLNLAMPSSPQSYQSDRFRADNLDCSNAIGSSTNVEFGVVGVIDTNPMIMNTGDMPIPGQTRDVGVYARITIPIGAPKERINCNTLYKLELEKKRLEVQKLKAELANLRALQFENNGDQ